MTFNFKTAHLCAFVFLSLSCSTNKESYYLTDGLVIEDVQIVTPENEELNTFFGTVLIDHDTIVYAGADDIKYDGNYDVIDGRGKYLIPGLIDSHVHLSSVAGMNYLHLRQYPEIANSYFDQLGKSYLYFGYTTLIDPNNYRPSTLNSIQENLSPDIYTCGEQIKVMNDFMMAEEP